MKKIKLKKGKIIKIREAANKHYPRNSYRLAWLLPEKGKLQSA